MEKVQKEGRMKRKNIKIIGEYKLEVLRLEITDLKICIIFKELVDDIILEKIHKEIFHKICS